MMKKLILYSLNSDIRFYDLSEDGKVDANYLLSILTYIRNWRVLALCFIFSISTNRVYAQNEWGGAGANNTTSEIWRTGRVGIGTQANSAFFLEVNGGDFHVNGDSYLDGGVKVGPLFLSNMQLGILGTSSDLYLNNFAICNGNVQIGKPGTGSVTVHNTLVIGTAMYVSPKLKITPNQICVEDVNTDMYINNAALGNGNVQLGKPGTGTCTVQNDARVNGNLMIGMQTQINPSYRLDVWGKARAHEIVVNTTGADFVFDDTYKLRPLLEVELFLKTYKHLPDILPASAMQADGVELGDLNTKLLQKVEELTLYIIDLEHRLQSIEAGSQK